MFMTVIIFIGFLIFCYIFRDSYKNKQEPKEENLKIKTYLHILKKKWTSTT